MINERLDIHKDMDMGVDEERRDGRRGGEGKTGGRGTAGAKPTCWQGRRGEREGRVEHEQYVVSLRHRRHQKSRWSRTHLQLVSV